MNVLQLNLNDIVFFDDDLIRITDIEDFSTYRIITFDILDNGLFHVPLGWSFYIVYKSDFDKDLFYV